MRSSNGRILNWPDEQYFADCDYVSNSMLKVFREDRDAYVSRFVKRDAKPKKSSSSMVLGTAVHQWWLEGITPVGEATYEGCPSGLRDVRKWAKENEIEGSLLNGKDSQAAVGMYEALLANPYAEMARARAGEGICENVVTWLQSVEGAVPVMCKAKIDLAGPQGDVWILDDLKTTRHPTLGLFEGSVAEYGYAYQAAFYREAIRSLGHDVGRCSLTAVSSKAPHTVFRLDFDEETLDFAFNTNQLGLAELSRAAFNGWAI